MNDETTMPGQVELPVVRFIDVPWSDTAWGADDRYTVTTQPVE